LSSSHKGANKNNQFDKAFNNLHCICLVNETLLFSRYAKIPFKKYSHRQ